MAERVSSGLLPSKKSAEAIAPHLCLTASKLRVGAAVETDMPKCRVLFSQIHVREVSPSRKSSSTTSGPRRRWTRPSRRRRRHTWAPRVRPKSLGERAHASLPAVAPLVNGVSIQQELVGDATRRERPEGARPSRVNPPHPPERPPGGIITNHKSEWALGHIICSTGRGIAFGSLSHPNHHPLSKLLEIKKRSFSVQRSAIRIATVSATLRMVVADNAAALIASTKFK